MIKINAIINGILGCRNILKGYGCIYFNITWNMNY